MSKNHKMLIFLIYDPKKADLASALGLFPVEQQQIQFQ
jgi:hypothetical protein